MDGSDARHPTLDVVLQHLDGHAEVLLIGELDIGAAPILRHAIDRLVADGHRDLQLNFSALTFLDAAGIGALVAAAQQLARLGGRLTVSGAHGPVLRVLTLCGMLDTFTADPDLAAPPSRQTETPADLA